MTDFTDMPLLEVAQLNTPEALDYFWARVDDGYFADREWFYEYVADECKTIVDLRETDVSIMDVGCAHGHFLQTFSKKLKNKAYFIVGIDYAESAIEICREKFPAYWHSFSVADITNWFELKPFYELITCIQTLEHIREWQTAIENIVALAALSGDIVITIPNGEVDTYPGHVNFWIEEEMRDHLAQYGTVVGSWQFNDGKNLFFHVRKSE